MKISLTLTLISGEVSEFHGKSLQHCSLAHVKDFMPIS